MCGLFTPHGVCKAGFEPATFGFLYRRSTPELLAGVCSFHHRQGVVMFCSPLTGLNRKSFFVLWFPTTQFRRFADGNRTRYLPLSNWACNRYTSAGTHNTLSDPVSLAAAWLPQMPSESRNPIDCSSVLSFNQFIKVASLTSQIPSS